MSLIKQWGALTSKDLQVELRRHLDQLERISTFIPLASLDFEGTNWARLGATDFWGLNCTTAGACAICYIPLILSIPHGYFIEKVQLHYRNSGALTTGAELGLYRHASNEQINTQLGSNSAASSTISGTSGILEVDLTNVREGLLDDDRSMGFHLVRIENLDQTAGASRFKAFGIQAIMKRQ